MGACESSHSNTINHGDNTKTIEKQLKEEKALQKKIIKILLLGAGEAGKSTILKQMRIIHDQGFTKDELISRKSCIYNELFATMHKLLQIMNENGLTLETEEEESYATVVIQVVSGSKMVSIEKEIPYEARTALKLLWEDKNVRNCYEDNKINFTDNVSYFFDSIERISGEEYMPTLQDMLMSRVETTAIIETNFNLQGKMFRVFDVGGQRTHRKKWFNCFDDVTAILFLVALSEYDQVLREDGETNRMIESLTLFDGTCNNRWFTNTPVILFLNKKDLFEQKLNVSSIKTAFLNYKGSQDYRESLDYIKAQFCEKNQNEKRGIYMHETCATDTTQVEVVLAAVVDICIEASSAGLGLA